MLEPYATAITSPFWVVAAGMKLARYEPLLSARPTASGAKFTAVAAKMQSRGTKLEVYSADVTVVRSENAQQVSDATLLYLKHRNSEAPVQIRFNA